MSERTSGTKAAVLTGKGSAALATIHVLGPQASQLIRGIFHPASSRSTELKRGTVLLGTIQDGGHTIDQVTIGCEARHLFAIHCHGNPLIVEQIMALLQRRGANLLTAEDLLTAIWREQRKLSTIAIEAKLLIPQAKTLLGTQLLHHQIEEGLSRIVHTWRERHTPVDLPAVREACRALLAGRLPVRHLIHGCTIVLVGAPNSGKSTLMNCLSARDAALVTDIQGTTRDWIETPCHLGSLYATLIDTAGLDRAITDHVIDRQAQAQTLELLQRADLVLLVLDRSRLDVTMHPRLLESLRQRPLIVIFNKSDLPARLDPKKLPNDLRSGIPVSAHHGNGVAELIDAIQYALGVSALDTRTAVCFTDRQRDLLAQLKTNDSSGTAGVLIDRLLRGELGAPR